MNDDITIMLPVHPVAFGLFLAILVIFMGYYVVKFFITLFLGG